MTPPVCDGDSVVPPPTGFDIDVDVDVDIGAAGAGVLARLLSDAGSMGSAPTPDSDRICWRIVNAERRSARSPVDRWIASEKGVSIECQD